MHRYAAPSGVADTCTAEYLRIQLALRHYVRAVAPHLHSAGDADDRVMVFRGGSIADSAASTSLICVRSIMSAAVQFADRRSNRSPCIAHQRQQRDAAAVLHLAFLTIPTRAAAASEPATRFHHPRQVLVIHHRHSVVLHARARSERSPILDIPVRTTPTRADVARKT